MTLPRLSSYLDVPEQWSLLNGICPYYTMFPISFPLEQLKLYPATTRVLDPFCGRGTTVYAARLVGVPAVGVDVNPVAVAIARAKLAKASLASVVGLAEALLSETAGEVPEGEFWRWCFHSDTLQEIVTLRQKLLYIKDTSASELLRAIVMGVLHGPRNVGEPSYLSNQMPRTYASKPDYAVRFWRARDLKPVRVNTLAVIRRRAERLLSELPPKVGGRVILGDATTSTEQLRSNFDLIVTSPPYYGMRTYVSDQWLRAWFLGGPPRVPYTTATVGQIALQPNQATFTSALAVTWRAVAGRSRVGAKLAVRFGTIPSAKTDPEKMILASLRESAAGWAVRDVCPVRPPAKKNRQASQFRRAGTAISEIDVTAELVARPM
jgi:SAM-dependent methyltransferase